LEHSLAGISGATNAVSFETDLLGPVTVSGPGAGRIETAYALLSDIIAIHQTAGGRGAAGSPAFAGSVEAATEEGGLARV
jgi:homoserine dehydrogenase